jgi:hypothetical protein
MKFVTKTLFWLFIGLAWLPAGCTDTAVKPAQPQPERLVVYHDGSMEFRDRPIPQEDVVIYPDGTGGERAAVKIRMEPLHPAFYRDSIVVERQ